MDIKKIGGCPWFSLENQIVHLDFLIDFRPSPLSIVAYVSPSYQIFKMEFNNILLPISDIVRYLGLHLWTKLKSSNHTETNGG